MEEREFYDSTKMTLTWIFLYRNISTKYEKFNCLQLHMAFDFEQQVEVLCLHKSLPVIDANKASTVCLPRSI